MYHPIISATKKEVRTMKVDHDYLFKLNNVLEKVRQAQLGLDKESRVEYRNMEIAIKEKIKEVSNKLNENLTELQNLLP
jgi:predicted transcriptional regulator